MLRASVLSALFLSTIPAVLSQFNDTCPPSLQRYNSSGLLGFFDPLLYGPIPEDSDSFRPTIDNDGFLYSTSEDSPSPPATFAFAYVVSRRDDVDYPAVVSTLLAAAPLNATSDHPNNNSGVACALTIHNLPTRTLRLGQDDDGTCTSTLPRGCAQKLVKAIADAPMDWPLADSNMTRLEKVCLGYADLLNRQIDYDQRDNSDLPDECTRLFAEDNASGEMRFVSSVQNTPLSSPDNDTTIREDIPFQCNHLGVVDETLGPNYISYAFWNDTPAVNMEDVEGSFTANYNDANHQIFPMITLFVRSPLLSSGTEKVRMLSTHLGCVRRTQYTDGSVRAPELAGLDLNSGLSGGEIAGIVVGVLVAVALVAGLLWWFCLRARRRTRRPESLGVPRKSHEKYEMIDR
jgi:hypothetical protein